MSLQSTPEYTRHATKTMAKCLPAVFSLVLLNACASVSDSDTPIENTDSVNNIMISSITPATNVLWGVGNPRTDSEWQQLAAAADSVIHSARLIKVGGTGPSDSIWAMDPVWQDLADALVSAAEISLDAVQNKNLDALLESGDALYSPCEECHNRFHPGLQ